ncbi:tyrosine-type recombinase/integrase [Novosphingobium terrae]|uniref:tyrosine-type recombinase/integrase n=1 Tax=Novosphingobium terrae TaxID=2726189 RepID=UPI00197D05A2|nr:tyrosine-type recombinase/integrase [Novosphingobium terrae]
MQALALEHRAFQRGFLLMLMTAARISKVIGGRVDEFSNGVWTLPPARTKNSVEHKIALGPWGQSLMRSNSEWLFPSELLDGPLSHMSWYKARNRIRTRMEKTAGKSIERFTPHDLRRTARSNTKGSV